VERHRAITQQEIDLTRNTGVSPDDLAEGLAALATERETANAEFEARAAPASALPVHTAYSLAWELEASVAQAYLRAVRSGDVRQRGVADGYTEASGSIAARASRLLDTLLTACGF
jgi:hypothetical protein